MIQTEELVPQAEADLLTVDLSKIRTEEDFQAIFSVIGNSLVRDLLRARADAYGRGALKPTAEILASITADQGILAPLTLG